MRIKTTKGHLTATDKKIIKVMLFNKWVCAKAGRHNDKFYKFDKEIENRIVITTTELDDYGQTIQRHHVAEFTIN